MLEGLCQGHDPRDLLRLHGAAMTALRPQIAAIRSKVGVQSIDAAVRAVARLPPVPGALRGGA